MPNGKSPVSFHHRWTERAGVALLVQKMSILPLACEQLLTRLSSCWPGTAPFGPPCQLVPGQHTSPLPPPFHARPSPRHARGRFRVGRQVSLVLEALEPLTQRAISTDLRRAANSPRTDLAAYPQTRAHERPGTRAGARICHQADAAGKKSFDNLAGGWLGQHCPTNAVRPLISIEPCEIAAPYCRKPHTDWDD